MRSFRARAALAAMVVVLASPVAAAAAEAVATIGSKPVTAADLQDFLATLTPQQREQAARDPKFSTDLVRSAIVRKLVLSAAETAGWDKKPEIAAQIAHAREEIVLGAYLGSVSQPPAGYPDEDEVRAAYDLNRDHLFQYQLAQIFLAEPPGADKETRDAIAKKALDLARKARAKGADFAALARANSQDAATAAKGGELGWLAQNQIIPEFLGAVMSLGEKGVSEPIHAAGGWHILDLSGVKPADFNQVKDQIAGALRETRTQQNRLAFLQKLLADDHVSVDETAAAALFAAKK